ncbi:hypothetical protein [Streptomyces sp. OV198]|uniref:hypothetical protein n=1 Tax=Streptomyces sp. OV198 TaxID=1882787 RepID=UPI000BE2E188|nr:hypothetical protein [Streptomyces sp. OV198]
MEPRPADEVVDSGGGVDHGDSEGVARLLPDLAFGAVGQYVAQGGREVSWRDVRAVCVREWQVEGDGRVQLLPVPQNDPADAASIRGIHDTPYEPNFLLDRERRDAARHFMCRLRM